MDDIVTVREQFCEYSRFIRGFSPKTITRYRVGVQQLQRRTGVTSVRQCTDEVVRGFFVRGRQERGWSASTFETYHRSLRVFFRWCVERGLLPSNPVEPIEIPRAPKALPVKLTEGEATRLLEWAANYPFPYRFQRVRNHAILATFLHAGLRKSELLSLKTSDVGLEGRSIFVRQGKGAKDRIVPISATLVAILTRYAGERERLGKTCPEFFTSLNRDHGLTQTGLRGLFHEVRQSTGLAVSAHKLRHSFATLMLEGGCDLFALKTMMGHSDIKTTAIYLTATIEHLRAQAARHPLNYRS